MKRDSKEDTADVFTEGSMFRVILELFLAGSETTYNSLDWAFLFMSEHPEIQEKCFKEISDVVYRLRRPSKVTIRRSNHFRVSKTCECCSFTELKGYRLPKNIVVLLNVYSALIDPKHWDEPNDFKPGRFIGLNGKVTKHDAQMSFGIGPRICLGEPLARMALLLVFANMIQKFKFKREYPSLRHSFERKPMRVTSSPESYKLRIKQRGIKPSALNVYEYILVLN